MFRRKRCLADGERSFSSEDMFSSKKRVKQVVWKNIFKNPLTKQDDSVIIIKRYEKMPICGCSSMVESQPSKLVAWVRFPSPAPKALKRCIGYAPLAQLDRATAF